MLNKYSAYFLISIAVCITGVAYAEPNSNELPYSNMSDEEVNQYVKDIIQNKRIMEAQLELQKILKQRSQLSSTESDNPQIEPPKNISGGMFRKKSAEPLVISIEGPKKHLVALLKVGSGNILRVRVGDTANGWKIVEINNDGVIASKEDETKLLPFTVMNSNQLNNPNQAY